jgi:hypothetical protein
MRYPLQERTSLRQLLERLEATPPAGDEQVCSVYDRLLVSLNADGAALGFFAGAAQVCRLRPHLAERVLREPVNCLVCLGMETPEEVFGYVRANLRENSWFRQEAGPEGVRWLSEELPRSGNLLQRLLVEETERNSRDD